MGIVGVMMGVVISMGLTMLIGFFYTPMHGVMVYLCLGNFGTSTMCSQMLRQAEWGIQNVVPNHTCHPVIYTLAHL